MRDGYVAASMVPSQISGLQYLLQKSVGHLLLRLVFVVLRHKGIIDIDLIQIFITNTDCRNIAAAIIENHFFESRELNTEARPEFWSTTPDTDYDRQVIGFGGGHGIHQMRDRSICYGVHPYSIYLREVLLENSKCSLPFLC